MAIGSIASAGENGLAVCLHDLDDDFEKSIVGFLGGLGEWLKLALMLGMPSWSCMVAEKLAAEIWKFSNLDLVTTAWALSNDGGRGSTRYGSVMGSGLALANGRGRWSAAP